MVADLRREVLGQTVASNYFEHNHAPKIKEIIPEISRT